ncbi:MAG TPA: hypothetical protein VMN79_19595 [Casimicrobiaceae bacterium]|nr:hypothetical protein [Casimicrobiaceae bacterium]
MSVMCMGRTRVLEQLGEKQDFEAELSRRGFRHEDFSLHVLPERTSAGGAGWDPRYEVSVSHAPTRTVRVYKAGPREDWVGRFAKDLVRGLYGEPSLGLRPGISAARPFA